MSKQSSEGSQLPTPDFTHVDSQEKIIQLAAQGRLEKIFLMPLALGGLDTPLNTLYVPLGFRDIKANIDQNIVLPLAKVGKITEYSATPDYQGSSLIPIAIRIVASNPGRFSTTLQIWGEALTP